MSTNAAFVFGAGAALVLAAIASRWSNRRFGAYCGLFVLGQAASLQLVVAGNKVGYQHYFSPDRFLSEAPRISIFVLLIEAVVVLIMLGPRWRQIAAGTKTLLPGWRRWAAAAVIFLTSATLSKNPTHYGAELVFASLVQLLHLGLLVLAAESFGPNKKPLRFLAAPPEGQYDPLPILCAVGATTVAVLLCVLSYERHPHVPDEVVYMYHARYFSEGLLTMPLPAAAESFNVDLMFYEADRWFCPVPPGWPAVLAVGYAVGLPFVVNPLLAGLAVLCAHSIVRTIYGRDTARIATVLFATSPWFLFLAMSFMTHTLSMSLAMFAAWGLSRLYRGHAVGWAVFAGAAIGGVSLVRPLEGVAVALVLGMWGLTFGGVARRLVNVGVMAVSTAAVGAITFPYNASLTGDPFKFPLMLYTDRLYGDGSNAMGFGPNRGLGWSGLDPFPGHGALDVFINANLNTFQVNIELHGFAIGSLLLLTVAVLSGRLRRADWGMVGAIGTVIFLHSFYWFSGGPDFGARYWYLIFFPSVVLTARGIEIIREVLPRWWSATQVAVVVLVVGCLFTMIPWRAIDKYHHYRLMRPGVRTAVVNAGLENALVFVRGRRHPDYASAVIYNPIDFSAAEPILAWDRGLEARREAVRAYPQRAVYILNGPSVTGADYELVAGPLVGLQAVETAFSELSP